MSSTTDKPLKILTAAAMDVIEERERQIEAEGFDLEHDDEHRRAELAKAAVCYLTNAIVAAELRAGGMEQAKIDEASAKAGAPKSWPWDRRWWKPAAPRQSLVKAAALIVAEIERLDRAEARWR